MSNLDIIKAYHAKIWDDKDLSAIDEYFAKDAVIQSPIKTTQGIEAMKEVIAQWLDAFPNLTVYWDDFICEGDKVVSRWHVMASQNGAFLCREPSNKEVNYSGVTIYQLDGGKITQYWAIVDMDTLKSQLP